MAIDWAYLRQVAFGLTGEERALLLRLAVARSCFRDAVILKRKRFGITAGDAPAALDSMAEGDYALAD